MISLCFGSAGIGVALGLIFSLLFVAFDTGWKKMLSSIFVSGTGGTGIWMFYEKCSITESSEIFVSIGTLFFSFAIIFIVFMLIMCKIIKDKDDKDIIRIRDIILGQKKYIEKYYEKREKDIDERLNIPSLEKREKELQVKEQHLATQIELIDKEKEEIAKLTQGKLKIKLPENKNITVTKEFLDLFPSYVEGLSMFIEGIKSETDVFIESHETANCNDFKVFLKLLSIHVSEHLFGKGARDVRVHFRYYDEQKNGYEKFISTIGDRENTKHMTFIPYDKANMIIKSFECKRGLIKSHNIDYDFVGNNSTTWTEYITVTFYNITRMNIPCLSFGISVKNATKFKNLFNFLNYCKFETYLQDVIEQFDEKYCIESILYGEHNM